MSCTVGGAKDILLVCLSKLILLFQASVFFFLQKCTGAYRLHHLILCVLPCYCESYITFMGEATLSLGMKGSSDTAFTMRHKEAFTIGCDLFPSALAILLFQGMRLTHSFATPVIEEACWILILFPAHFTCWLLGCLSTPLNAGHHLCRAWASGQS